MHKTKMTRIELALADLADLVTDARCALRDAPRHGPDGPALLKFGRESANLALQRINKLAADYQTVLSALYAAADTVADLRCALDGIEIEGIEERAEAAMQKLLELKH